MRNKNEIKAPILDVGYYLFPAIHGYQGKHEYYLIQCPLKVLSRIFSSSEQLPPKLRQKKLSASLVRELARYLISQPDDYVLAPLVVAVDCATVFESLTHESPYIGTLKVPLAAQMMIYDGQHRCAAIQQVLSNNFQLGDDTVPIMVIPDPELARSPRLYADLNQGQIKHTRSQQVLHDHHTPLAALVRQLVDDLPLFKGVTELEKTTISNRSTALFTLSAVYQSTKALLGVGRNDPIGDGQSATARRFWQELGQIIPEWKRVITHEVTPAYLRQNYVHVHSVTLLAIGGACHSLINTYPDSWSKRLVVLGEIDWSRRNTTLWEGRAMVRGRMSKARDSVVLTANAIKQKLGLKLTEQEWELEQRLLNL